jgi:hypothetical protein
VRRAALFGVALATMVAVAGCGGGGKKTLTKEQYASALSTLCLSGSDQIRELHLDNTVASWKADGDDVLKIEQAFKDKLAALSPPAEIENAAREYTDANDTVFGHIKDAVDAANAGDKTKLLQALSKANAASAATTPPAKEIGAKGCYIG